MTHWNYRIVKRVHKEQRHDGTDYIEYSLHEAYYDEDEKVNAITDEPMVPHGDTPQELIEVLEQMLSDAKKCVDDPLDYDNMP